jgi:signal peptidase I
MLNWLKEEKEKNNLRFFTYTVYGVLLGLFFLMLFGLFGLFVGSQGNLNKMFLFNSRPTIIITGSMEPAIQVNSIVMLEPVEFKI